jgi:hypothetical protein
MTGRATAAKHGRVGCVVTARPTASGPLPPKLATPNVNAARADGERTPRREPSIEGQADNSDVTSEGVGAPLSARNEVGTMYQCPECGGPVSELAAACPKCGRPAGAMATPAAVAPEFAPRGRRKNTIIGLGAIAAIVLAGGALFGTVVLPKMAGQPAATPTAAPSVAASATLAPTSTPLPTASPKPVMQVVGGMFTLRDTSVNPSIAFDGKTCHGTGGYSDIAAGAPVTLRDENGTILGATVLPDGEKMVADCFFVFAMGKVPDTAQFYVITVSHRGEMSKSHADLAADNWIFDLTLGS